MILSSSSGQVEVGESSVRIPATAARDQSCAPIRGVMASNLGLTSNHLAEVCFPAYIK